MSGNPYQAPGPVHLPFPSAALTGPVSIREQHLSTEASVKGAAILHLLGGSLLALFCVGMLMDLATQADHGPGGGSQESLSAAWPVVGLVLAVLQFMTGLALRKFRPRARVVAIVFSCIGLIFIPIGTVVCGYFLYLLAGKKGAFIFTPAYQEIIAATPEMKYKGSLLVSALLVALFVLLGLGALIVLGRGGG